VAIGQVIHVCTNRCIAFRPICVSLIVGPNSHRRYDFQSKEIAVVLDTAAFRDPKGITWYKTNFWTTKFSGMDNIYMNLLICKYSFIYTSYTCTHSHVHMYTQMWTTKILLDVFSVDILTPNFAEICRVDSEMKETERHTLCNNEFRQRYMVHIRKFIFMHVDGRLGRKYERLWQKGVWIWWHLKRKNLLPPFPVQDKLRSKCSHTVHSFWMKRQPLLNRKWSNVTFHLSSGRKWEVENRREQTNMEQDCCM